MIAFILGSLMAYATPEALIEASKAEIDRAMTLELPDVHVSYLIPTALPHDFPRSRSDPTPGPGLTWSICWTRGRSGPFVGPWAVRAHLLDPGPFGPINWALGCLGPSIGLWAVRAHWLGM